VINFQVSLGEEVLTAGITETDAGFGKVDTQSLPPDPRRRPQAKENVCCSSTVCR
ncbi:hypothetical protein BaRGS_00018431, partial [Batillaria attramentaria]